MLFNITLMSDNAETVKQLMEDIRSASKELRELVYSAPTHWMFGSPGSAFSVEQIGDALDSIEQDVKDAQRYCDEEYKEVTDALLSVMWSGLQTRNYDAILHAAKQLISIELDYNKQPFSMKPE